MITVVAGLGLAAQTPEARTETAPRVMSWTFASSGGYLGVQTVEVSNENFGKYGLSGVRGVAVEKVLEGSPAERAGIQAGDVIVRVNNDDITSTQKLTRLIGEFSPDHTARITVFRGGSERELSVTIGKRPAPKFDEAGLFGRLAQVPRAPGSPEMPGVEGFPRVPLAPGEPGVFYFGSGRRIGIGLTPLTKELAEHFGVESGAMVNSVGKDSPAARAGLRVGDIIVEADGKAVKSEVDVVRAIAAKKEGDITVTIVRDRSRQTINVSPEEVKVGPENLLRFYEGSEAPGVFRMTRPLEPGTPPAPSLPLMPFGRIV